ncbi:protein kinase domain-containing protein [Oceanospirillum beijerinckii]|uniref:protein kinase domain-containing protein n=1 Tax=Oceanospirillum beijerinckii TaxID=64976 RepID=UPI000416F6F0|nr:protein kinase [Oceanospirillum beijerinckii]
MPFFNDDYFIHKQIGEGATAKVYLAEEKGTGKTVVLKHYERIKNQKKFDNEIEALKINNQYPKAIQYLNHAPHTQGQYIVFEHNDSVSLPVHLHKGHRFSLLQCLQMAEDILKAIAFNHQNHMMHLDLWPKNIVFNGKHFYLIDFGNAKLGQNVKNHDVGFNSLYMAPELYIGQRNLASEIYSVGCILYYMVTQGNINQMFNLSPSSTKAEKIYAHVYKKPFFGDDFPRRIASLITGMLRKDAKRRPSIARLLSIIQELKQASDITEFQQQPTTLEIYEKMARDGIAYGLFKLGRFYEKGHHVEVDLDKAQHFYEQAVHKGYVEAYYHLGELLIHSDEERALALLKYSEQHSPTINLDNLQHSRVLELKSLYQGAKAEKNIRLQRSTLEKLIQLTDEARYYNMLGILYNRQGLGEKARVTFEKGLQLDPTKDTLLSNLANYYLEEYDFDQAKAVLQQLVKHHPDNAGAYLKLATLYKEKHRFDQARYFYLQALARRPGDAKIQNRLGQTLLLTGEFEEGFKYREGRLGLQKHTYLHPKITKAKLYNGEQDLRGKTVLVYREQGLGDTIQFVRYLPLLKARGAKIIFRVNPPLLPLLENTSYIDRLLTHNDDIGHITFDYHVSLLSLPYFFTKDLASVPVEVPYLKVQQGTTSPVNVDKTKFNIGIAWEGGSKSANNDKRNVDISYFSRLFHIDNIELYSLQLARQNEAIVERGYQDHIIDVADKLNDMQDTAALIEQMDLVISVDTSIIHLAGALNHPAWMPTQFTPDYRWGLKDETSYWYPSIRLFREMKRKEDGNWDDSFTRIEAELVKLAETQLSHLKKRPNEVSGFA